MRPLREDGGGDWEGGIKSLKKVSVGLESAFIHTVGLSSQLLDYWI